MSYGSVVNNTGTASRQVWAQIDDGEYDSTSISCVMNFAGQPVSSLTEGQQDDLFQDFVDYVAAYPGLTAEPISASKTFSSGQAVTPTE